MNFGESVKASLEQKGKSVYWLSKTTGIPKTTIYGMINRGAKMTKHETAIKAALDMTHDQPPFRHLTECEIERITLAVADAVRNVLTGVIV